VLGVVAVGLAAAVCVLVRLPLMNLPLDPDEGGYALVAHRWAQGAALYSPGAWVDRPPGLMLVFRWVGDMAYSQTGLRAAAAVAAVVLTVAAASAAWALSGRRAGVVAGLLTAVVSAGAWVQGYQLNGELLAAAVGACGVAVTLWWRPGSLAVPWLVLGGALAGAAPLMKQSGWDGLMVVLAVAAASSGRTRALPAALLGALVPLGATAAWAAVAGWDRWWYALARFQAEVSAGQPADRRFPSLWHGLVHVTPDLGLLLIAAALAAVLTWPDRRRAWPALLWPLAAAVPAATGPFGHPHYWVQVVAPAAVLAAQLVPAVRRVSAPLRWVARGALAAALLAPLVGQAYLLAHSPGQRVTLLSSDHRLAANPSVAAWLRAHSRPSDQVYALAASADLYLLADRGTTFPYLWYEPVQRVPGAPALLRSWLTSGDGPRFVVVYQRPQDVDPSGALSEVLARRYREVAKVDGYEVLERLTAPTP
jgi:hypothetical protein